MKDELPCVEDTGSRPPRLLLMARKHSEQPWLKYEVEKDGWMAQVDRKEGSGEPARSRYQRSLEASLQLTGDPGLDPADPLSYTQDSI